MRNFGRIKDMFNTLLVEGIDTGDKKKKKLFKEYIKLIKNNKILKEQFLMYNNIENKVEIDEHKATEFVKFSIDVLSKYSEKEIIEANQTLVDHLLIETKLPSVNGKYVQLHEDVTNLIFTKKITKNVDLMLESLHGVVGYIRDNEVSDVVVNENILPNSLLSKIAVDKFNDKYSNFSDSEKQVLKSVMEGDESKKINTLNKLNRDCIDLIDINLVESDIDSKDKLLQVKDKLLRSKYVSETYISDVSNLIELKNDLTL